MVRRIKKQLYTKIRSLFTSQNIRLGTVAIIMTFVGFWGISVIRGATPTVFIEAESGTQTGSISQTNDSASSGQTAVLFGGTPPAPTNVAALTGGDSIAVVWDMPAPNIKTVDVLRDGTKIGTVTPGTGVLRGDIQGTHYIDKDVTRGTTYKYQVRVTNKFNNMSPLSAQVSATHPASVRTPVPNVVVDTSKTTAYTDFLQANIVPEIKTWYPKFSDTLAWPDYTAYSGTITLMPDPTYDGAAYVGGELPAGWIRFSPNYRQDGGMFIHETTHIMQGYSGSSNPTGILTESLAEWVRDWFYRERYKIQTTPLSTTLMNGPYDGSYMYEQGKKYDPNFPHKMNVAIRKGTYSSSYAASLTGGRNEDQLLNEARSAWYGNSGAITGIGGKCIDIASGNTADQTKIQLYTCNNQNPQKWRLVWKDAGLNAGYNGSTKSAFYIMNSSIGAADGKCIDIQSSGTTSGTIVWSYGCGLGSFNTAQLWTFGPNGTIIGKYSGLCLSTTGNGSEDGNQLIIATCNGGAGQKWATPAAP